MTSIAQKILMSIMVDIEWITTPNIPYKARYIITKYTFLLFPLFFWDAASHSYKLTVFNQTFHLPTLTHIAFLQGTFTDHAHLTAYIAPGATVVDIGAHIGEFVLMCKNCLHAKQVFSFEPVRQSYELLIRNSSFVSYHAAVGIKQEETVYIPQDTVLSSVFRTSPEDATEVSQCLSPDAIPAIASLPVIDLFKIDVEGMEYDVILASKQTIQKSSYILVELSLNRPKTASALATIALLQEIIPDITLLHIGTVFAPQRNNRKQLAVDMLFHNPSAATL